MADRWCWRWSHSLHLDSLVRRLSPCKHQWLDTGCEPGVAPHVYVHKCYTHAPSPFAFSQPDREQWQRVVRFCRYWFGTYTGARVQLPQRLGRCEFSDADGTLPIWGDSCRCEHYSSYDDICAFGNCTLSMMTILDTTLAFLITRTPPMSCSCFLVVFLLLDEALVTVVTGQPCYADRRSFVVLLDSSRGLLMKSFVLSLSRW